MNTYESMLIARKVRMILLFGFIAFVALQQMWWLAAIGGFLVLLTLW